MGFFNNKETKEEKDNEDNEEVVKTYCIDITCSNCGSIFEFDIPKGRTVKDQKSMTTCEDCGCYMNSGDEE